MKSKIDALTENTFKYTRKFITSKDVRVLEVGCGEGDLGLELMKLNIDFVAIDIDREAIKLALSKGVNAQCIDFLQFKDRAFDVILFTRSLHHMHDLNKAINHAKLLLKKEGKLIIEEFDFKKIDINTARWYYDMTSIMTLFAGKEPTDYIKNPTESWENEHCHEPELNSGEIMTRSIEDSFKLISKDHNAYLFRSICRHLDSDEKGYSLTKKVYDIENGLITNGLILPTGLRIVAEKLNMLD